MEAEKQAILKYIASKLPGYVKYKQGKDKVLVKVGFEAIIDFNKSDWIVELDQSIKQMIESSTDYQHQRDLAEIYRQACDFPVL